MKLVLLCVALLAFQLPSRDSEPTVVMPSNHAAITFDYGGKYVQLRNSAEIVNMPKIVPKTLPSGLPWYVDVINFGPRNVTLQWNDGEFSVRLLPKDSVRITATQSGYKVIH
ncbi:MAG TPA: hypothetical protein VMB19_09690 [Silvibacterium sp.]|nr:hypothetical protein [Silvibacterium sp.]